ncbi:MAG: S8 family serine peptidase [Bacteroidota bacterium]|nr:S8 family serine peptidase [Bacteroidota bacterium]
MLSSKKFNPIVLFALLFAGFSHLVAAQEPAPEFKDQVVIVQFESGTTIGKRATKTNLSGFDRAAERYDVYEIERVYPFLDYVKPTSKTAENLDALRRTYYVRYRAQADPVRVSRDFSSELGVVYAEPVLVIRRYGPVPQEEPSDPQFELQQPYLELVNLPEAWDLVKAEDASEPIVIAIIDTGGDWDHEDLLANVWVNEDEIPDNGIDDDNNGFIDDVHGVNLNNGDDANNDPTPNPNYLETTYHGTAVAGTASAVTDNGVGVAGAAWNAKLMHVNIFCEVEEICGAFEGILYAAVNGADIINTSFGGFPGGERLRMVPQALDLATDMGALVVAAAGNAISNNDLLPTYPDSHPRVLSVGATEQDSGQLAEFSNYGKSVSIYAPGVDINTTTPDNEYDSVLGTSFSSPLVAGIAALVKTRFPHMSPDELREQLRLSAKNIDADNSLPLYEGQLNGGLVNAKAGLQAVTVPAVRVKKWSWKDNEGDQQIDPGDEVTVNVTFINYLAATQQLTVKLVPLEAYPYITLLDAEQSLGVLETGDSTMATFRFSVADDVDQIRATHFSVNVRDGSFTDEPDVLNFPRPLNLEDLVGALHALYESTDGDNWLDNSGWDTTATPTIEELNGWFGVQVIQDWVDITLPGNNLTGMIPPELGQAAGLRNLWLPANQLSGSIPQELGQLTELETLILSHNLLTGSIHPELGQLLRLNVLSIELNELSGSIPPEIGQLSELRYLGLTVNRLSGTIPPELSQLSKLEGLRLSTNQFTGPIPPELGQLSELLASELADNQLTGTVPPELGQLSILTALDLSNNALTGSLPRSLLQLDSLKFFVFSGQELCAPEDDEFQAWLQNIDTVIGPTCTAVAIEETSERGSIPENFAVQGNYPNPVRETTQLTFDLPWQARVRVEVIDVIGRHVLSVPESDMMAGWSKRIELNGAALPAGLYLYRVIADSPTERSVQVGRFVRIR